MNATESLRLFLPETFLVVGAFLVLIFDLFTNNKKVTGILSLLVLAGTAALVKNPAAPVSLFYGFFQLDSFTHFFRMAALGITAVTILISLPYNALPKHDEGDYYSLFLFMAFGLILMAASTNLLAIFIAIEFVSILSYLLVGFLKRDPKAKEAAVKYLLVGSLASGVMLYGMSLVFGASGSLELVEIGKALSSNPEFLPLSVLAFLFFAAGLGFKISMAPFHMWAPDVYEAAPTPVTAFLTVGPKALGFAVFLRVATLGFSWMSLKWTAVIMLLSIITMTIGNVSAVAQNNIKRLLAYSSIAQAGYILMGLAAFNQTGLSAILVYIAAYAFTNLGIFTAVIAVSNHTGSDLIESYAGLGKKSPFLAASITLFLLSLAGIPPLAGFIGKFFVFSSAIQGGLIYLAVAAALNSAVAAFYYFKIVRAMYLTPYDGGETVAVPFSLNFALVFLLAGTLLLGLFPSPLLGLVTSILS